MSNRSGRTPWEEFKKQCVDQPAHALWGLATGVSPFVFERLGAYVAEAWISWDPWETFFPGLIIGGLFSLGSIAGWIIREIRQWPPRPDAPWDPWLDSIVFGLAVLAGFLYQFWG